VRERKDGAVARRRLEELTADVGVQPLPAPHLQRSPLVALAADRRDVVVVTCLPALLGHGLPNDQRVGLGR
jgi:hypothetical protein